MNNLIKISDISNKYQISARTLRYYEDMGLLTSIRPEEVSYRMYDEKAIIRIEQILILRKLNISIKDIKRIFSTTGSDIVLEVLGQKVESIDEEVSLLYELKSIVLSFIQEFESLNFSNDDSIKELYTKVKAIEGEIVSVDYKEKASDVNRLIEITEKLDKKVPDVMVVRVPSFRALSSKKRSWEEIFSNGGYMFKLWQHYSSFRPIIFDCLDFTLVHNDNYGEMICSIDDDLRFEDVEDLEIINFEGGLYAMAVSIDEDDESINKVQEKIIKWLDTTNFILDEDRAFMFNMPYLDEGNDFQQDIEKGLGYRQMQRYLPIKLK